MRSVRLDASASSAKRFNFSGLPPQFKKSSERSRITSVPYSARPVNVILLSVTLADSVG